MPPKRLNAKTRPGPETAAYNPPPAPSKASPALQLARMEAARRMNKYGDVAKEKSLAEQWVANKPDRRISKKSSVVHARHSEPGHKHVNQHEINKFGDMVRRSLKHVEGTDPSTPIALERAVFAKNLASRIEKHGVKPGPASAMATVAGMFMPALQVQLRKDK